MVGLLTDKAIATYKPLPTLSYEKEKIILSLNLLILYKTTEWDFQSALEELKPEVVIHGDD